MRHDFYTVKGGQGCTVTTVLAALAFQDTLIVDAANGDVPTVLGGATPQGPDQGLTNWSQTTNLHDAPSRLYRLAVATGGGISYIPHGNGHSTYVPAWLGRDTTVVVDWGLLPNHDVPNQAPHTRKWLVTTNCYISLGHAISKDGRPDGIVLIDDGFSALTSDDVATAIGVPVVATIKRSALIRRTVDAGILLARIPTGLDELRDLNNQDQEVTL